MSQSSERERRRREAQGYASQIERFLIRSVEVGMRSNTGACTVRYVEGKWQCDCGASQESDACVHVLSIKLLMNDFPFGQSQPVKGS